MKIVGISACVAGIAHTYIAREKLIKAAEKAGHEIHLETQGTIGTEHALTENQNSRSRCSGFGRGHQNQRKRTLYGKENDRDSDRNRNSFGNGLG